MRDTSTAELQPPATVNETVEHLVVLATRGLSQMFDPERKLFCHALKQNSRGLVREGISHRYTVITLLGLHRLRQCGGLPPIDTNAVLKFLLADLNWVDNIGDLGLLLWLCALAAPERLPMLGTRMILSQALDRYSDACQGRTMELAWFLAGLSHCSLVSRPKLPALIEVTVRAYRRLIRNQGKGGMFAHSSRDAGLNGWIRGEIGSFADQIYPIYALATFSQAYHRVEATQHARDCADVLCESQGELGQWWWHYDSSDSHVVEGYPVFSVHQHGMAPLTLFALQDATKGDYRPFIEKGIHWVGGANELGLNLEDIPNSLIWRCLYRPGVSRYWDFGLNRQLRRDEDPSRKKLRILYECRPYELGWLLYAFAGRFAKPYDHCGIQSRT
jgi:hypothetical protein